MKSPGWVLFVMLLVTSGWLAADIGTVLADGWQWGNKTIAERSASLPA